MKLDRQMMEGVYGRSVSAIEVLRGWEPTPAQFKALYSALQVISCIASADRGKHGTDATPSRCYGL